MTVELPAHSLYGNEPIPIEFPDDWDVSVAGFAGENAPAMTEAEIAAAIRDPNTGKPIHQAAKGCRTAVIIFDDITRATPIEPIAKAVLAELEEAGVQPENTEFMAAVGCHRCMSREDYVLKLGEEIVSKYRVWSHNPFFNCVPVGETSNGISIALNAECVAADYKIAIGAIFPHSSTGAGGGGKIILPGVASFETIRDWHHTDSGMWRTSGECRTAVNEAAQMLGLDIKIDVLMNGKGEISRVFAGDWEKNLWDNYDEIQRFFYTEHISDVDLLLVNNYFKPTEPNTALVQMGMVETVRPGGDIILSFHSPQGCAAHYMWGKWGISGVGGPMYRKQWRIPEGVNRFFIFTEYPDLGCGTSYYLNEDDNIFCKKWDEVLKELGTTPRRVGIYKYGSACCFEDKQGVR